MDIYELYSMLCKKITQSAGGVTKVSLGSDGNSIDFTLASGAVDNVPFPQQLTQAQKDLIAKFSVNATGKLLFDGKEITPDFLNTTGAGNKFLADDGTYKTISEDQKNQLKDYYVKLVSNTDMSDFGIDDLSTLTSLLDLTKVLGYHVRFTIQVNAGATSTLYNSNIIPVDKAGLLILTCEYARGSAIYHTYDNMIYATSTDNSTTIEWRAWSRLLDNSDDKNIYHFSSPTEGDANTLVVKGKSVHYQISNTVMTSGAITNLPADIGVGGLLISHGLATVHQFFLTHNNRVYKRYGYYNGTDTEVTWVGTWQRVITENDFNETVNGNGGIRIEIPQNANMNDYTIAGFYKVLSGAVAKTIANLPIQNACLINIYGNSSSATGWMTQEIIADNAITNNRYIRYKSQSNVNWSPWEKIVTTSVADVPKTTITFSDTTNYVAFGSSTLNYYIVKNGICYVSLDISVISKASEWTTMCTLPRPIAIKIDTSHSFVDEVGDSYVGYGVWDDGTLRIKKGENGIRYIITFSYPVAE